jgi:hypothetical protein
MLIALVSAADAQTPTWMTDYSAAQKRGVAQKKPLAVVVGNGAAGWEAVARDGKLDPAVLEKLQASYVCVYVDAKTERGQALAQAFALTHGLIISDVTGEKQAFRHEGALSNTDLTSVVSRFADTTRSVTQTETQVQSEIRYYPSEGAAPGNGAAVPSYLIPSSGSYCPSCQRR